MTSSFGFMQRGDNGQLILGDDNPTLVQRYRGKLVITNAPPYIPEYEGVNYYSGPVGYGWCVISYPSAVTTQLPPMVFATPNHPTYAVGIGMFSHIGTPGKWTGFKCGVLDELWGGTQPRTKGSAPTLPIGCDSQWEYRVCTFGGPPSGEKYGMRIWDKTGELVFDSGWQLVFFSQLLSNWTQLNTGTRNYNMERYWGNEYSGGSSDQVMQVFSSPWGHSDGNAGILISSAAVTQVLGDIGSANAVVPTPPFIGFTSSSRATIQMSFMYGLFQHPCTAAGVLPYYRFMTADFSKCS